MLKYIFLLLFFYLNAFALTPFSLEGLQSTNIKVLDKSKFTTEENLEKIIKKVNTTLYNLGIETKSENFSNFIVKIQGEKVENIYLLHVSLMLIEESYPLRNKEQETMSITYYKDDLFSTTFENLQDAIYDSIVGYLLFDMSEQYKEENE